MRIYTTLIFCLILQSVAFAKDEKKLVVRVYLLGTHQPLEGIKIIGNDKNKTTLFSNTTDSTGTLVFSGIGTSKFNLECVDPSGEYASMRKEVILKNQDTLFIRLRYNKAKEDELIRRKTTFNVTDSVKVNTLDCAESTTAVYQGGVYGLSNYMKENLEYPEEAIIEGTKGKVYIKFKVDSIGELKTIRILKGVDKTLDDCAIRTLAYMPNWSPGTCNGKPVDMYFTLPITFGFSRKGK